MELKRVASSYTAPQRGPFTGNSWVFSLKASHWVCVHKAKMLSKGCGHASVTRRAVCQSRALGSVWCQQAEVKAFCHRWRVLAKARHPTSDGVHTIVNKGLPGNRMKDRRNSATLWDTELLEVLLSICCKSHTGKDSLFCNPVRKDLVCKW